MTTQVFRTRGAEETSATLEGLYGRVAVSFPSPSSEMRIERDEIGPLTLDHVHFDMWAAFEVQPVQMISICQVRGGWTQIEPTAAGEVIGPGGLIVPGAFDRPYSAVTEDLDHEATTFPEQLLSQVAATLHDPEIDPVRLSEYRPISPAAARQYDWVRAYVLRTARQIPDDLGATVTELVVGSLARLMATTVLATFPNTALTEPTPVDRRDAHPDSLRRAIGFIESHPDLNLSVADMARASHVSARALQLAFSRHLNTSPMAYLRRVRLERAHGDLRAATPADSTVTAIATRWGYARPSRFSADYLAAYGRHPHETLRDTSD